MKQHARADLAAPDLLELLALDDAGFKRALPAHPFCAPNAAACCAMFASPWEMWQMNPPCPPCAKPLKIPNH